eukprot:CAMPEP_0115175148 /NCGR_PEP_ID=MMETSP0270-20121206/4208_1 /TAXON_ID=71861 /ORGANISM="Scrippsiella trochoidea, Strain CCMP3099" /LENGTH=340 /DNA_ID=CAMNT_0002588015 /DNA_START=118 /DNA_END=1140 /DNA_ORIENTATION=-
MAHALLDPPLLWNMFPVKVTPASSLQPKRIDIAREGAAMTRDVEKGESMLQGSRESRLAMPLSGLKSSSLLADVGMENLPCGNAAADGTALVQAHSSSASNGVGFASTISNRENFGAHKGAWSDAKGSDSHHDFSLGFAESSTTASLLSELRSRSSPCYQDANLVDFDGQVGQPLACADVVETLVSPSASSAPVKLTENHTTLVLDDNLCELQSIGSVLHALEKCRACHFVWSTTGCTKGFECKYCHFLHREEPKGRKKRPCKAKRDNYRKLLGEVESTFQASLSESQSENLAHTLKYMGKSPSRLLQASDSAAIVPTTAPGSISSGHEVDTRIIKKWSF